MQAASLSAMTHEQLLAAHKEILAGATQRSVAAQFGTNQRQLRRMLDRAGLSSKPEPITTWDEGIANKYLVMKLRQA